MGMKRVYDCNICRDEMHKSQLYGIKFTNAKNFKIDSVDSTDSVHICRGCIIQLKQQLEILEINSPQ